MLVRALFVFLIVLNLGIALWWALHPVAPTGPAVDLGEGVARLQLLSERGAAPAVAGVAGVALPRVDTGALVEGAVCISLGPFPDTAAAAAAAGRVDALRSRVSERSGGRPRGWRVIVPPQASPEQAQAVAARIAAAGITDYFVMRTGADANAVALGRYQSEDAARRRAQTLTAAGFAVRAEPVGSGPVVAWLDLALPPDADPDAVQAAAGVSEQRPVDCASLP